MKRCTNRLFKLKLLKLSLDKKITSKEDSKYKDEDEKDEREFFFDVIIPNIESCLDGGKPYVTGYDYTIADIAYFNEVSNILMILDENIEEGKFPNTQKWMKRIEDITQIRALLLKG